MKQIVLWVCMLVLVTAPSTAHGAPEPQLPEDYSEFSDPADPVINPPDSDDPLLGPPPSEDDDEDACPVYRADNWFYWNMGWHAENPNPVQWRGPGPSCLDDIVSSVYSTCEGQQWFDDCLFNTFADILENVPYIRTGPIGVRTEQAYYFDEDCLAVDMDPQNLEEACDTVLIWAYQSPISLLFGPLDKFENEATLARFPLRPHSSNAWYTWKASGEAPLLVFDPEKTGNITNATQLFGDWTFGGKRLASMGQPAPAAVKWQNGFEALETLDENRDGRIAGEELAPLALWFDENRDGISDPGEVRPIEDEGIKSLGYTVSRVDERSKNIYVNAGFEREVSGKLVTGTAVDWYGHGAKSKTELISKQLAQGTVCNKPLKEPMKPMTLEDDTPLSSSNTSFPLEGLWRWQATGADSKKTDGGILAFSRDKDGNLAGYSLIEHRLKENRVGASSMVMRFEFENIQLEDRGSTVAVSWRSNSKAGSAESTGTFDRDSQTLKATTEAELLSQTGELIVVKYDWTATRVGSKGK